MAANINPSGPTTGIANPNCYAAADKNCSIQVSREHTISASLLRQVEHNKTVKISGLRWQKPQVFDLFPINSLASRVLCDRHNSALSPLDTAISTFSKSLAKFESELKKETAESVNEEVCLSGEDIQSWMLKFLIGSVFSGNGNGLLDPICVDLLYGRLNWPRAWGMYWTFEPQPITYYSNSFLIETQVDPRNGIIKVVRIYVRGFLLVLCLGVPDRPTEFGFLRPRGFEFVSDYSRKRIIFEWNEVGSNEFVIFTRAGSYGGPPPNWQEWERK